MCFTGNFALSLMLEPAMLAPVLSQPSLPMGQAGGMHIAPDELAAVKERMEREDLTVLAYRFEGDSFCRAERFAAYQQALGDRFVGRVLPDSAANPDAPMKNPHSVVTRAPDRPRRASRRAPPSTRSSTSSRRACTERRGVSAVLDRATPLQIAIRELAAPLGWDALRSATARSAGLLAARQRARGRTLRALVVRGRGALRDRACVRRSHRGRAVPA